MNDFYTSLFMMAALFGSAIIVIFVAVMLAAIGYRLVKRILKND